MDGRRTLRARKVSTQMAVVDESSRKQAAQARLDALENDNDAGDILAEESDDEVVLHDDDDDEDDETGSAKKGKKGSKRTGGGGSKRKLRGGSVGARGPRSFNRLLEDSILDSTQQATGRASLPGYLSLAAGPPVTGAPRKLCSVCGHEAPYTCSRCRSKFCNRKCYSVHVETRCLKFTL